MAVNPFNVMSLGRVNLMDPTKVAYRDAIDILHDEFHRTRKSFIKIGFYLKHIRDNTLYLEDGYKNINDFALDIFNISQSTTSRYIKICEEFSIGGNSPDLNEKYEEYNISQLFELLTVSEDKIEQITPKMSIREIRELKSSEKQAREAEELPGQTSIEQDFPEYMPPEPEAIQESSATSHKQPEKKTFCSEVPESDEEQEGAIEESHIIDGEFREISIENQEDDTQKGKMPVNKSISLIEGKKKENSAFPVLKNEEQRKAWLKDYKAWGLWYRDENIDVNYYKYDFPDGSRLICCEYLSREFDWADEIIDQIYYHLLEKNKSKYGKKKTYDEKFCHSTTSETYLIEFLKRFK